MIFHVLFTFQVNTFLQTISMNAPVISLLGFADVNRKLFRDVSIKLNKDGTGLSSYLV
jgi:hypothetical protein